MYLGLQKILTNPDRTVYTQVNSATVTEVEDASVWANRPVYDGDGQVVGSESYQIHRAFIHKTGEAPTLVQGTSSLIVSDLGSATNKDHQSG